MLKKVDSQGNYVAFPGVTIIAPIVQTSAESELLRYLHDFLSHSPLFTKYYAPLPYSSFHMTTCNLYTKSGSPEWYQFINDNLEFFQNLCTYLKDHEFNPEVTIEGLEFGRALQLRLSIPENQEKLIYDLAQTFNIQEGIPPFFHITLAYGYKQIDNERLRQDMITKLEQVMAPYINQKIKLEIPTLCSFESMKAFTPWDGKSYPFHDTSRTKKITNFFGNQEPSNQMSSESSICECSYNQSL